MELLKEIAHISGKPGLFRIVKPTRTGVIVETLDEKKEKTVVSGNSRVSVLKDISVYTTEGKDGAKPLADLLLAIKQKGVEKLSDLDVKNATDNQMRDFLAEIEPTFDRERVYPSDIRKMVNWFHILDKNIPEIFETNSAEAEA
jgi:Domain of unknown function (DUF5606)